MKIGVGLPATVPGTSGNLILEWARQADAGQFSTLGIIDRVVYPNYEPMVTLAAVAGVTQRIGLMTTVLLAPLRDTAMLAKEAASLDALSNGRLTLGLGIGGREDDFVACGVDMHTRGKRFDEQLAEMRRIWSGERLSASVGPIGPRPAQTGGPRILIGANSPAALARLGRWGEGYIAGGAPPRIAKAGYDAAEQAWKAAGRAGKPYFAGGMYFALGDEAGERGRAYLRDYYGFAGPMADAIATSLPTSAQAIQEAIAAYRETGMDELILWPTVAELDQLNQLAQVIQS
jgi:alkanesulfonate monooxygenase SsuD/methylene tetrahydromethanopterin reductase-like flavin-dependent oxidoreductase (luciferase family)